MSSNQRDPVADEIDYGTPSTFTAMSPDGPVSSLQYTKEVWPRDETGTLDDQTVIASTAPGTVAISGTVIDDDTGRPLIGADLTWTAPAARDCSACTRRDRVSTTSSSTGGYGFINLPAGNPYDRGTITVVAEGYGNFTYAHLQGGPGTTAAWTVGLTSRDQYMDDRAGHR